jgi:hypothetical protein
MKEKQTIISSVIQNKVAKIRDFSRIRMKKKSDFHVLNNFFPTFVALNKVNNHKKNHYHEKVFCINAVLRMF